MRHHFAIAVLFGLLASPLRTVAAQTDLPAYLRDRGTGIRTSIFGTYVRRGELRLSPFFEYYHDNDLEYKPTEFGFTDSTDYRGRYRASEGLVFVSYGLTDWLAVEFEAAVISASLETSPADTSAMPAKVSESGQGDWQIQFDFRMLEEGPRRPEVFGYFEVVFPSNRSKPLTGTPDYEFKGGVGLIRGFSWGTLTARVAVQHSKSEGVTELGEWAIEYLRRLSPRWRVYAGIEGTQDEVEAIGEVQWHPSERVYLRFNCAAGVTSKATDLAPDVGIVFSIPLSPR